MRLDLLFRILFILYCVEAGVFLAWAPWTPFWERSMAAAPAPELVAALLTPLVRAGVCAFGVVHLVWGAHDLDVLFQTRFLRRELPSDDPSAGDHAG